MQFSEAAQALATLAQRFYDRGWLMGTSGNLSAVVQREPLQVAITASGQDKSGLGAEQIVLVDKGARACGGNGSPSAETLLHLAVIEARGAGAVLHTHSIWSTTLSEKMAGRGAVTIDGFEMLKGLAGVRSHEHSESLPILENSQDMAALARRVKQTLAEQPGIHGFLLRRHGLYTWGRDLPEAKRHVEVLEFLLEAVGRLMIV